MLCYVIDHLSLRELPFPLDLALFDRISSVETNRSSAPKTRPEAPSLPAQDRQDAPAADGALRSQGRHGDSTSKQRRARVNRPLTNAA